MKYDVIIIGAGVGGLFSAYQLTKDGKKVLLIDKQSVPGGVATTFTRKGFTFESSIHCVDAMGTDGEVRQYLREYGLDARVEFIPIKNFGRLIYPDHDFIVHSGRDAFLESLRKAFPLEQKNLKRLFIHFDKFFLHFSRYRDSAVPTWLELLLMPFLCPLVMKASCMTADEFMRGYLRDTKLQAMLSDIWRYIGLPPKRVSAFYFLMLLGGYYYQPTAHIKGGFMKLFEVMVEEIRMAGSEVLLNTEVTAIIMRHGVAESVQTATGDVFSASAVISNVNPITTLTGLIDDAGIRKAYSLKLAQLEKSPSAVQVYLGLSKHPRDLGMVSHRYSINTSYEHEESFKRCYDGDYETCCIELTSHSQLDPTLAPSGKGSLVIMTYDVYEHWAGLERNDYLKKKEEVAQILIRRVEKYLPGLTAAIELKEVATPLTMQRYSGSPEGSLYGFAQTVSQAGLHRLKQKTAVQGLYLVGGWTFPGGGVHACFNSAMETSHFVSEYLQRKRP